MFEVALYMVGGLGYASLMLAMRGAATRSLTGGRIPQRLRNMNTPLPAVNAELQSLFGHREAAGDPDEEPTTPWTDPKKAELDIDVMVSDELV